jgi:two-component system chemotaxis response regulator CheB
MAAPQKQSQPAVVPETFIVIGTSAGGLAALSEIVKKLPADLPAAVLVVRHVIGHPAESAVPQHLMRVGHLPVKIAEEGETIRQGTIYIAPSGRHLRAEADDGHVRLSTDPPAQRARPSIDVLFDSAANAFGSRVIGVILTGRLRDGALGLRAVAAAGGITIVQNPEGAEQAEMPRAAMADLAVDYCLELSEIGPLLELLARRVSSNDHSVLESGLASTVRMMKDRVQLLAKLYAQSRGNPKTERFLEAEMAALRQDMTEIQRLIPATRSAPSPSDGGR